jgi:hypothetical protein
MLAYFKMKDSVLFPKNIIVPQTVADGSFEVKYTGALAVPTTLRDPLTIRETPGENAILTPASIVNFTSGRTVTSWVNKYGLSFKKSVVF